MANFKIDIEKISFDCKSKNKAFKKSEFTEIAGVSHPTVLSWAEKAPDVVELIYWNAKAGNHSFLELIEKNYDLFPCFKLLKYYNAVTGNPIESVILES